MPDWNGLTSILAQDAGTAPGTSPPIVAECYQKRYGRVQLVEAVRAALFTNEAGPGKAHRAFARLPFDTIYTTNFDLLLEEAYAEEKRPFRSLVGEVQLPFHAGRLASSIVKMHGDLRHEEHIVLTESDYAAFLSRYPVIATHLSAMLITRTPLFLGYSLSDPDFNNVRRVVRERLGAFERMAYVVQFNVEEEQIEKALAEKIHIVSLDVRAGRDYDDALATFLESIQRQLDSSAVQELRSSRPDVFEPLEPTALKTAASSPAEVSLLETTSKLCFVLMPFSKHFDEVYRSLIQPVAAEQGLAVLRADEMAGQGVILEQIRAAIAQARVVVADISGGNANVLYELGFAHALEKSVVMIAKQASKLPFDVAHQRVIIYGSDVQEARGRLAEAFLVTLLDDRLAEAAKLLQLGAHRGAIAATAVVLEHKLRELVGGSTPEELPVAGLNRMIGRAIDRGLLEPSLSKRLKRAVAVRNRAVHHTAKPTRSDATLVLSVAQDLIELSASNSK